MYVKVLTPVIEDTGKNVHVVQRWSLHLCIMSISYPETLITGSNILGVERIGHSLELRLEDACLPVAFGGRFKLREQIFGGITIGSVALRLANQGSQ